MVVVECRKGNVSVFLGITDVLVLLLEDLNELLLVDATVWVLALKGLGIRYNRDIDKKKVLEKVVYQELAIPLFDFVLRQASVVLEQLELLWR